MSVRDVESGISCYLFSFHLQIFLLIESYMNWINTPTLPKWKKLYGTIMSNMNVGKYSITIANSKKDILILNLNFI